MLLDVRDIVQVSPPFWGRFAVPLFPCTRDRLTHEKNLCFIVLYNRLMPSSVFIHPPLLPQLCPRISPRCGRTQHLGQDYRSPTAYEQSKYCVIEALSISIHLITPTVRS